MAADPTRQGAQAAVAAIAFVLVLSLILHDLIAFAAWRRGFTRGFRDDRLQVGLESGPDARPVPRPIKFALIYPFLTAVTGVPTLSVIRVIINCGA